MKYRVPPPLAHLYRWKEDNICQSIWYKSEVLWKPCWGTHWEPRKSEKKSFPHPFSKANLELHPNYKFRCHYITTKRNPMPLWFLFLCNEFFHLCLKTFIYIKTMDQLFYLINQEQLLYCAMLSKSCNIYIDPKPIYYPISTNINFTLLRPKIIV